MADWKLSLSYMLYFRNMWEQHVYVLPNLFGQLTDLLGHHMRIERDLFDQSDVPSTLDLPRVKHLRPNMYRSNDLRRPARLFPLLLPQAR